MKTRLPKQPPYIATAMLVLISIILLVGALYIILVGSYPEGTQNWAYGTIGTVTGYWLPRVEPA